MKICSICKEIKNTTEFHGHLSTKDRLHKECKICRNAESRALYKKKIENKSNTIDKRSLRTRKSNREVLDTQNIYSKNRYKNDPEYRLARVLRARLRSALKNQYKQTSAVKSLGCSLSELKTYLESKFQPGMNWENHGKYGWHIDHVTPLVSFNLSDPAQAAKACHYTNLQPLWAIDNLRKHGKVA